MNRKLAPFFLEKRVTGCSEWESRELAFLHTLRRQRTESTWPKPAWAQVVSFRGHNNPRRELSLSPSYRWEN